MGTLDSYFKELLSTTQSIRKQFAPLMGMHETTMDSMLSIIEAQDKLHESLKPFIKSQEKLFADQEKIYAQFVANITIPSSFIQHIAEISQPAFEYRNLLEDLVSPHIDDIVKSFYVLPHKIRNALTVLGNNGWSYDLKMDNAHLWKLEKAFNSENPDDAENTLIEYYRERLPEIESSIHAIFPHREPIIKKAFIAHSRGDYELSIPVFLAQADGVCHERIKFQLYSKENDKPATARHVEKIGADTIQSAILSPLANRFPISATSKERGEKFKELNRHQVIHGESVDYGTEINSLKTISLLNYIVQVLGKEEMDDGSNHSELN